jgi:hypothetical protein
VDTNIFIPGKPVAFVYNNEIRAGVVEKVAKLGTPDCIVTLKCNLRNAFRTFRVDKMTPLPEEMHIEDEK